MGGKTEVEKFIAFERENTEMGIRFVGEVDANSMLVAEQLADAFEALSTKFGQNTTISDRYREYGEWCATHGITGRDAIEFAEKAVIIGGTSGPDPAASAKVLIRQTEAYLARAYLVLRLRRDYLYGLTDILKNRLIAGIGFFRVQCETAAMILIFHDDVEPGAAWLRAAGGPPSKEFYSKYRKMIRRRVGEMGFDSYYEEASALSQHSRVGGVGLGILSGGKAPHDRAEGIRIARLAYTDTDDLKTFFLFFSHYLRFHARIFRCLAERTPEFAGDPAMAELAICLDVSVDGLFASLEPMIAGASWRSFLRDGSR